jgi:hypothetical protein
MYPSWRSYAQKWVGMKMPEKINSKRIWGTFFARELAQQSLWVNGGRDKKRN